MRRCSRLRNLSHMGNITRGEDIDFVYDISNIFVSSSSFEDICQSVVNFIVKKSVFNQSAIFLLTDDDRSIYPFVVARNRISLNVLKVLPMSIKEMKIELSQNDNLVARAVRDKKYYFHPDFRKFTPPQV